MHHRRPADAADIAAGLHLAAAGSRTKWEERAEGCGTEAVVAGVRGAAVAEIGVGQGRPAVLVHGQGAPWMLGQCTASSSDCLCDRGHRRARRHVPRLDGRDCHRDCALESAHAHAHAHARDYDHGRDEDCGRDSDEGFDCCDGWSDGWSGGAEGSGSVKSDEQGSGCCVAAAAAAAAVCPRASRPRREGDRAFDCHHAIEERRQQADFGCDCGCGCRAAVVDCVLCEAIVIAIDPVDCCFLRARLAHAL